LAKNKKVNQFIGRAPKFGFCAINNRIAPAVTMNKRHTRRLLKKTKMIWKKILGKMNPDIRLLKLKTNPGDVSVYIGIGLKLKKKNI